LLRCWNLCGRRPHLTEPSVSQRFTFRISTGAPRVLVSRPS
jgi:hypothetical protein